MTAWSEIDRLIWRSSASRRLKREQETGRGDGHPAGGDPETLGRVHDADGLFDVGPVVEGLAHAHEDVVGQVAAERGFEEEDLADDLGRQEIPLEAVPAAGAESAGELAADLGRETDRQAAPGWDEDGLDVLAVAEAEEEPRRAVWEERLSATSGRSKGEAGRQLLPERLRQRGEVLELRRSLL